MWESPIYQTTKRIAEEITKQHDDEVTKVITQTIGYKVDKEELIKALEYDRSQYKKGYQDAKTEMLAKVKQAKLEAEDIRELTIDGWKTPGELKEEFIKILDKLVAESEG